MQQLREQPAVPVVEKHPVPPNADELPYSDDMPMESERHVAQMYLLGLPLKHHWRDRPDTYVGMNMFVYFSAEQRFNQDFRGPDVFVAVDVRPGERLRWVVWEELKGPDVVIELLSDSTRVIDMTEKKQVYQDYLRVPEYFWYDPFSGELAGWALRDGRYEEIPPDDEGRLPSRVTGLALVRWHGTYAGVETLWLRWATTDGALLPFPDERALQAEQRAEAAEQRAAGLQVRLDDVERRLAELERQLRDAEPSAVKPSNTGNSPASAQGSNNVG
jgi:Uma2 family endonuclease